MHYTFPYIDNPAFNLGRNLYKFALWTPIIHITAHAHEPFFKYFPGFLRQPLNFRLSFAKISKPAFNNFLYCGSLFNICYNFNTWVENTCVPIFASQQKVFDCH